MPNISGVVRTETMAPALGATVRAFDKDLRNEQLLGRVVITETSGRYEITYSAEQFRRAEKKTADLVVRAFDPDGRLRAESPIRFNAGNDERIDLTFERLPVVERPRLSELEVLQQSIEPVREDVAYGDFTDPDLTLLTEEVIRAGSAGASERRTVRQRLEFLRLADQFARQTGLPIAAFYGWVRRDQPQDLDALFDVPPPTLQAELVAAIRDRIIPDITRKIPGILERIRSLRFAQGRAVNHRFAVQLVDQDTGRPLIGYSVAVGDPVAELGEALGTVITDGYGICVIVFGLERATSATAGRRLHLTISDAGIDVAETTIVAQPNQEQVTTVRVSLRRDDTGNIPIEGAAPAAIAERLHASGIRTFDELLAHPELQDEDPEALEHLRAAAKLAIVLHEVNSTGRNHLLDSRFRSLRDVAAASRAEFVSSHGDALGGDAASFATLDATRASVAVLYHMIGSAWLKQVTTPGDDPEDPDIPTGVNETLSAFQKCGCKDCSAAMSPAAYLAHLLQWTLEHVKDGTASIAFSQLEEEFHQPFGDLPASCAAVEKQVLQVRIAVETLWRFTGLIDRDDLQLTTSFRGAYRELRNQLYRAILTQLGTSFEQVRGAMLQIDGDNASAQQLAVQRRAVADVLGIEESRLGGLFFNIGQPPISPSEDELQQRFGYRSTRAADVFAPVATPELVAWQRERLESIWREQDWPTDDYSGEARFPFVDPVLVDDSYLRTPLESNAAFVLLDARRAAHAAHRQELVDQNPQQSGLAALLESELGQGIDQLRSLFATLRAGEEGEAIVEAQATIASLQLTPAGFIHLMGIDALLEAGQPIGDTAESIDAAWASIFDILAGAHRRSLFPEWVEEENALALVLGPALFWLPVVPAAPPNPWQATPAERVAWQEALARRTTRPIIDPDQIPASRIVVIAYFVGFGEQDEELPLAATQPPLDAMDLWQQRRAWVDARLDALREARQNQSGALATFEAVLSASTCGLDLDTLAGLAVAAAEGEDLAPRLAQHSLTKAEYRLLAEIHELARGNASVTSEMWRKVDATLVAIEKRRRFAQWRIEEQAADITLHPHRFVIPKDPQAAEDAEPVAELHDPIALQQWTDLLQARADQLAASRTNVEQAVAAGEEMVLPLLRNILIMESVAAGSSLAEKADWLDRRLLIDMRMDGCHRTTRVSQAIETLQRLVRGVYAHEHMSLMDHITLDADEDYETEWPVLGSYADWRALMLAYLFPENLLHLSPPRRQSYGFDELKKQLSSRPTHAEACARARAYGDYFKDVCNLEIQATCQIKTFAGDDAEGCESSAHAAPSTLHVFARAQTSGKVYWATLDPAKEHTDTTSSWKPIPTLGVVERICGATCHFTPGGKRFVLLFLSVRASGKIELRVAKYDVDELFWSNDTALGVPTEADSGFSACVVQKRGASADFQGGDLGFPTLVAIKPETGPIYLNQVSQEAVGWESSTWTPLFGPRMNDGFTSVLALIQRTSNEYLIVAELAGMDAGTHYRLLYRTGSGRDDLTWTRVGFSEGYNGCFSWFGDPSTFLFYTDAGQTVYQVVGATGNFEASSTFTYHQNVNFDDSLSLEARLRDQARQIADDIVRFNDEWLEKWVGVSLRDYKLSNFRPQFFVPREDEEGEIDPLNPDRENVTESEDAIGFVGVALDLLDVFSYELKGIDITIPDDARFRYHSLDLEFYQIQLQYQFVQEFLKHIAGIDAAKLLDGDLGRWKFADQQIRRFSDEGLSLGELIGRFADNLTQVYLPHYSGGIYKLKATRFRERDKSDELGSSHTASGNQWLFAPTSGDERAGGLPRKAVVLQERNGRAFWARLRRTGDALSHSRLGQLAPRGTGPFKLLPQRDLAALKERRLDIETIWKPHRDAPPSVRGYLKEAYNLLPMYLGYALQRGANYEEALLWYRQVFDYLQPSGSQRKIDYTLRLEEELGYGFDDAAEWLDDASNAHAIAATRKNTYTRHALLMIIRCMIDHADALFSRDNVSDNSRATELYTRVLTLLDLPTLHPGTSPCANIIGEMEIDVVDSVVLPLQQFKLALGQVPDPDHLRPVVTALTAIARDTSRPAIDRLAQMRNSLLTGLGEVPAPPRMTDVLQTKRATAAALENQLASHRSSRALLTKVQQRKRQATVANLAEVSDRSEEELEQGTIALPWLRIARPIDDSADPDRLPPMTLVSNGGPARLSVVGHINSALPMTSLAAKQGNNFAAGAGISFDFCIPQNPVSRALQTRAHNNLLKLRTCRNIAGLERQLDPYGAPIGIGSGLVSPDGSLFSGVIDAPPTPYRYAALISRAKELVGVSQQIEAGYQAALERAENEALNVMQAEQSVELAGARIALQDLRITQATGELGLAELQKTSAQLRESTYAAWIVAGPSDFEDSMVQAYKDAGAAQQSAAIAAATAQAANFQMAALPPDSLGDKAGGLVTGTYVARAVLANVATAAAIAEGFYNVKAIKAQTSAQVNAAYASFERRNEEWQFQRELAAKDVQIGDQHIAVAQGQIDIVRQERVIAGLEQTHAVDTLRFLLNKHFDEEMYRWIASVLEDVYRFFLQQATAIARLAERQLAFERQQPPLKIVQADYWSVAADSASSGNGTDGVDRLGLTGSARLLKDIYQLDSFAFETRQRKQALTFTLDLAALYPFEFQQFRETGVLIFDTPQSLIDRQMPGYYLCLIQQVSVSVVALVPRIYGIRATLTSSGISRVATGGDTFQMITLRSLPESIGLTSATPAPGSVTLEPDSQSLLSPFEGTGFDTRWKLQMPLASNTFDYDSMATVLFTVSVTALYSMDYEREVIARQDRRLSFDRAFDFRQVFPDPWYDLNNPDQTSTPMAVRFNTLRSDFPPNLVNLSMQHVMLYVVRRSGETFEQPIRHLHFTAEGVNAPIGGGTSTVNGRVSTRGSNGANWLPMMGQPPFGAWELALPDDADTRQRFAGESIENILLVLSVAGQTPVIM